MKKFLLALPLILGAFGFTNASAAMAIRVGVVDLPQVLQNSPQVSTINSQLRSQFTGQQQKIISVQNNLRAESSKLAPNAKVTDAEKKNIENQIASDQKELQTLIIKYQQELSAAQTKAVNQFMSEVSNVVKNIAQKQNLDLVLMKQAVMYAPNTIDITQEVLQNLPKN